MRLSSRRSFLTAGGLAIGGLALFGPQGEKHPLARLLLSLRRREVAELKSEEFHAQVGKRVHLSAEDGTRFHARIARVTKIRVDSRVEQFTIGLETELETAIPQGNFQLQNSDLGVCELFLVPVVTRRDRIDYEAAFGRLLA